MYFGGASYFSCPCVDFYTVLFLLFCLCVVRGRSYFSIFVFVVLIVPVVRWSFVVI